MMDLIREDLGVLASKWIISLVKNPFMARA